ncbi:zinc knuckle CX2CX4HX4C containing protein [Tanacetum coccineum]
MGDNGSAKKPFSFMSALTGGRVSGDNKLKFVPGSVNNEGREVAKMDHVMENGSTKWNMTVIGHFVGYQMSYRETMGNFRRMWRPCEFDDIIMNNSGLYFCKFKSHGGMQTIIENGTHGLVVNKQFFVQKWEPRITTAMCEKSYGRASFVRVLVEVDSIKGLVDEVEVWYRSLNRAAVKGLCIEEIKEDLESVKPISDITSWVMVLLSNMFLREMRKAVSNEREGMKVDKKDLGNMGSNGMGNVNYDNGNGSMQCSNSKKSNADNELNSKNRFSMLNDDEGSEESIVWKDFCTRIDVACEIGITIDEAEKLTWSEKMMDYFLAKLKNNNDKVLTPEEVLKSRIDGLQKQIVEGNKGLRKNAERAYEKELEKVKGLKWERDMLEVDFFVCSNQPLTDNIKEFWTDDMVEYFKRVNEEKESDKINGHWCDVDEGSNATACFMAQDDVSNIHDEYMADMQGGIASHSSNFQ